MDNLFLQCRLLSCCSLLCYHVALAMRSGSVVGSAFLVRLGEPKRLSVRMKMMLHASRPQATRSFRLTIGPTASTSERSSMASNLRPQR